MIPQYAQIPEAVINDLKSKRNRNPLTHGSENTNAVFVEIGKNLIVDYIIDQWEISKGRRSEVQAIDTGSGSSYVTDL